MVFRPRSGQSKANRVYEEMKLSGGNIFTFAPSSGSSSSYNNSGASVYSSSVNNSADLEDPVPEDNAGGSNYASSASYGSMRNRNYTYHK